MFGSYLINERKKTPVRLNLRFKEGELNFYACAIKILEGNIKSHYDFTADVMNPKWDPKNAVKKLKEEKEALICDALLEQEIFSGVGNIIKNEVLYRVRVHPESIVKKIPAVKAREIVKEARIYSFEFLKWKKKFELKKHWLAHTRKKCQRCDLPILKIYAGVKKRRSFYCENCQRLYQ
jgi:endonuclease-8